ncbi:MAG TPA: glycosyltransferase [Gemmatimonadaceae bacterium]|nr:glycosyltransferase [Gemmatimonadaceae bacterium]
MTVITTVHNSEAFIERCIQSVLGQTYSNWEQIIVDDGSTDRTAELVDSYEDPRIRFIPLPHRGIAALAESYNAALATARGQLIAVLEGDDFWPSDKLARQVPAFHDPMVQLSWGDAIVTNAEGRPTHRWPRAGAGREVSLETLFHELTCANMLTPTVTVMARRSALEAVGGFQQPPGVLFVDLPTWLKIAAHVSGKALRLNVLLGYYRVHAAQMSTTHFHSYQTALPTVVSAVLKECTASDLARLGWNGQAQQRSLASAELFAGVALLKRKKWRDARRALRASFAYLESPRTIMRVLLGLASTFVALDLVAFADRGRRTLAAFALRLDR